MKDGLGRSSPEDHEKDSRRHRQKDGGVNGIADPVSPARPDEIGHNHVGSDRQPDKETDEQRDDRHVGPDRGHLPGTGIAPDDRQIGGVEELLEHAGKGQCHGESHDLLHQRTVRHIDFVPVHFCRLALNLCQLSPVPFRLCLIHSFPLF